jgi:LacI family transcriptional regulator
MAHITQNDIAKILNVSRITISKALRDHPDISSETKDKVRQIAEDLGYIPNLTATSLHTRKSSTIGVVVPDVTNSFFSYVVHGIMDAASSCGYHIILTISRENAEVEMENIKNLLSLRVDGLLVAVSKETVDTAIYETVKKIRIPLIFFDRTIENIGFSSIGIDDKTASSKLVTFAVKQGYNKFAHLAGSYTTNIGKNRAMGYLAILKKYNLLIKKSWIIEGGFDRASGYSGFKKILASGELPEVIFAANDRIAQGAYEAIRETGLQIPQDIGVIAHGHAEFAKLLSPALTIVHVSPEELGRHAMKLLATHISSNTSFKEKKVILNTELIINKSILLK